MKNCGKNTSGDCFLSQNWGKVMVKTQKLKFSGQNIIRLQICYQNKIVPSCYQRNNRT
jgi:hypothetical protein